MTATEDASMSVYYVVALNGEGEEIGSYESGPNKHTANKEAKQSLRDDPDWQAAGMARVKVEDGNGVCHYDHRG
jgi:hypothetical protein